MRHAGSSRGTRMSVTILGLAALLVALGADSGQAGTVTYQEGDGKNAVSQTDDAMLDETSPDTNFGATSRCFIDQTPHQHCVLKFPNVFGGGVDQIPLGSHIVNATLTVYVTDASSECPIVYQLTEPWTEVEATWNDRMNLVAWASPGAEGAASHKPVPEGVLPCSTLNVLESVDVTGSVQAWSDGEPNEGWVFVNPASNDGTHFATSEESTFARRPQLTVSFVPTVFFSVGTDTGDLKTGLPTITIAADSTATLSVAQANDVGVGDEIDYGSPSKLVYISSVISPTEFTVQGPDGSAPGPDAGDVNEIRRAFNTIADAVAMSGDINHLGTFDLTASFKRLQWVLYDDGPFDIFLTASITGYTTALDYNLTMTVAEASQVATGNSQRHAGVAGTGARLVMQVTTQYVLDVDVPYTHIEWVEIDGNDLPMVGGIQVKPGGHETFVLNSLIHNTRGDSTTGSAVNVAVGADDVQVYNLVAYDYGGDGVFMGGSFGKVANSTFFLGANPASSSIRTDPAGNTVGYNVLAVGPGTAFREDAPGGLQLYNCISSDSSACDLDFSGFCKTNVSAASEFMSQSPVDLHLAPGAAALDFGYDLTGIVDDDIDGQPRPMDGAYDVGADEAPLAPAAKTSHRSIGTAPVLTAGLVDVTVGSDVVTGVGTSWLAQNRGRGDVITIPCVSPPTCPSGTDYTILAVDSDSSLRLTEPYGGPTASGLTHRVDRQFDTLQEWEDCISNGGSCVYFPTAGGDLVADDRSEVGIAYADSIFTLPSDVLLDGSNTDPFHTITLTADGINRHNGIPGAGVLVDGLASGNAIIVRDDNVTIEWIEIVNVRGGTGLASILVEGSGQTNLLFQNLLIHDFYSGGAGGVAGIGLSNAGLGNRQVTIRNCMIWNGDEEGIQGGRPSDVVTVENCSIDDMRFLGASGIDAGEGVVAAVNTIVTRSNGGVDFNPDVGTFSPASRNNISSDGSAPGANAVPNVLPGDLFVTPGVDLHLQTAGANPAIDTGENLFPTVGFQNDVDGQLRPVGPAWDRGADESSSSTVDLALTKDDGQTSAVPGTPISYVITVTNNGPDAVTGVIVNDSLPPEILGPWFSTTNGTYNSGTGVWTFAAPLFMGESTSLTFNGTVDPAATGTLTNSAVVSPLPGQSDPNAGNDSDTDVNTLDPETDVEITKVESADPIDIGNVLTYALTVTNHGPSEATNVVVVDTLLPDLEYQSATWSQGSCSYDVPSRTLTCNLGVVPSGGIALVYVVVRPLTEGTFGNQANVGGTEPDPIPGNNSSSTTTTVAGSQSCIVTTDLEGGDDWGSGVGVQADGSIVLGGYGYRPVPGGQDFAVLRYTPGLMLDASFGTAGKSATDIDTEDVAEAFTLYSDGRILLGGRDRAGVSDDDFALVRYEPDGNIDLSFNPTGAYGEVPHLPGIVTTQVNMNWDIGRATVLQPDGKILMAGAVRIGAVGSDFDIGVVRYEPDGNLDSTFGAGGKVLTAVGLDRDYATSITLQTDGKIVVGGATWNGTDWDWMLARYDSDGTLDGTFGAGGLVVTDHGIDDWTDAVAVQPDGRIVLIGQSQTGADVDFLVARYNPDGTPDTTFNPTGTFGDPPNQPGMVFVRNGPGQDLIGGGLLQPDGRILAVGWSDNGINTDFAMVRFNPDGSLDASFGVGGRVRTAIGADGDEAHAVALQPDGRILLAGRSYNIGTANWDFALARYTPTGQLEGGCGTTRYRSIGIAMDYSAGSVDVTSGSTLVNGSGTLWVTANRGRGDVITIAGVPYTVFSVDSETSLRLTQPYAGATATEPYTIARQFRGGGVAEQALRDWESCISGALPCPYFPVGSGNLITDNRSEVGVAYKDSVFAMTFELRISGSITDALHTITLTANPRNRHDGSPGTGVVIDAQDGPNGIDVEDDYVTLEWLEVRRFRGIDNEGVITLSGGDGPRGVLLQNLLIHDFFDPVNDVQGIRLSGVGVKEVTVRNTMIWDGDEQGIRGDEPNDVVTIENTSIDGMADIGSQGIYTEYSTLIVTNTIVTGSDAADFDTGFLGSFLGSNNTSSDTTAPGPGFQHNVPAGAVFAGPGNLRLLPGPNPAIDTGVDLFSSSGFRGDFEGQLRPVDVAWDRGADELSLSAIDLALTKDDGLFTAVPGTPISYTITVTNNGPDPITNVTVADPVPPAILAPFFNTANGSYAPGTGLWTFAAPLLSGQSAILTLNGVIDPSATGTLTNIATVSAPSGLTDTNSSNDTDSDLDTLSPEADLEITKTDDIDPVEVGGTLTYTLTVANHGPSDATLVTVTDVLPPEVEYQSDTPSQGLCNYTAPTLTCDLGSIAASGSATISVVVRPTAVATVSNSASVAGNEPDPVSANDSATETTDIVMAAEGVLFFTATSTFEQNLLEWLNPPGADYDYTEIVYRTDTFPSAPVEAGTTSIYTGGTAGLKDSFLHVTGGGSNGQTYYYAAFVHHVVAPVSGPRFVTGRPFDNTLPNATQWAFSTGAFSITPPTVSGAAVVAPANDGGVYAMARGPLGGQWPVNWHPAQLGGVVQSRSPVIPLTVNGANPVVYLGAQDGNVYTVNGTLGGAAAFPWGPTSIAGIVQAAPAGLFSAWGGVDDYILVGTRDDGVDNAFVALNPDVPGNVIDTFVNGGSPTGIGIITGMATVDYATDRVYFTSYENTSGSNSTLWCLQLGPASGAFTKLWERALGDIDGSPVVHNGRVYVGSTNAGGTVYSINAATGAMIDDRTFVHGDGPVKGFVWPDRGSNDLYFATNNLVWGITDTGAPAMSPKFGGGGSVSLGGGGITPSTVLFVPGSHYLYVGGSDGNLWELDVLPLTPTQKFETLGDGAALVGAPSLDWFHSLIHVGTEAGIFYAVQVPLP